MRCEPRCPIHRKREWRHHMIACETSCNLWRHSGRFTTAVQACVFASIARKTRTDSPPVTVNNPMRTSARLANPKVMAVVKTAPKSVAEELNRLIAHKTSTKIPIAIRVQPIPMRRAEKNDSAGNRGFFMVMDILAASFPIRQSKTTLVPHRRSYQSRVYLCAGGFRKRGSRTSKINQPETLCNLAGIFVASQGGFQLPYEVLLQRIND